MKDSHYQGLKENRDRVAGELKGRGDDSELMLEDVRLVTEVILSKM